MRTVTIRMRGAIFLVKWPPCASPQGSTAIRTGMPLSWP
jgi:hypothetical protein